MWLGYLPTHANFYSFVVNFLQIIVTGKSDTRPRIFEFYFRFSRLQKQKVLSNRGIYAQNQIHISLTWMLIVSNS